MQIKLNLINSSDLLNVYTKDYTKKYNTTIFILNIFLCHAHLTISRTKEHTLHISYSSPLKLKTLQNILQGLGWGAIVNAVMEFRV